jgi:DMSO/TMAO reductase YedYZ molybdopterin-dependent catalytic subunit
MNILQSLRSVCLLPALLLGLGSMPVLAQGDSPVLLRVTGQVNRPLALTRAQLQAMPRKEFAENRTVVQDGKEVTLTVRYQGIALRQLLDEAGLKPDRHAVRRAVVLLTAHDGYQASFSWGELYNSAVGDGVIVVMRHGADELLDVDGFPALRSLQDLRPGPRHVRWLTDIQVLLP